MITFLLASLIHEGSHYKCMYTLLVQGCFSRELLPVMQDITLLARVVDELNIYIP